MMTRALRAAAAAPRLLVELGSGDGTFLLKVARRLGTSGTACARLLVDRRPSVSAATRDGFEAAGWTIDVCESDVFEWLCRPRAETADVTIANLFLHHFREGELAHLLNLAAQQTTRFIACEPRRSRTGPRRHLAAAAARLQRRHPARRAMSAYARVSAIAS